MERGYFRQRDPQGQWHGGRTVEQGSIVRRLAGLGIRLRVGCRQSTESPRQSAVTGWLAGVLFKENAQSSLCPNFSPNDK